MLVKAGSHPQDNKRVTQLTLKASTFEEERIVTALYEAIASGILELSYPVSKDNIRVISFAFNLSEEV